MKKLITLFLVFGFIGIAYAASSPLAGGPSVLTVAVINATAPNYTGQMVVCSDCTNQNIGKGTVCQSSGTAAGAWIISGSSAAVTTACR